MGNLQGFSLDGTKQSLLYFHFKAANDLLNSYAILNTKQNGGQFIDVFFIITVKQLFNKTEK